MIAQDATPMFVMILRELADLQARSLTNQMVSERILELVGEEPANIHAAVVKIHAASGQRRIDFAFAAA